VSTPKDTLLVFKGILSGPGSGLGVRIFIDCLALERAPLRDKRALEDKSSVEESMRGIAGFGGILAIALKPADGPFSLIILQGRSCLPGVAPRVRGSL